MPETPRNPDPQTSDKKYLQTTIGDLRKLYGADFAKGCAENEKIADVVQKQPSLMRVIRHREVKRFEQICKSASSSNRARDSAEALVRTPFARHRIPLIADALLRHGTLSGDDIRVMIRPDA